MIGIKGHIQMTQKLSNNSFIFFIFVAFILIYLKLGLVTHSKTFFAPIIPDVDLIKGSK